MKWNRCSMLAARFYNHYCCWHWTSTTTTTTCTTILHAHQNLLQWSSVRSVAATKVEIVPLFCQSTFELFLMSLQFLQEKCPETESFDEASDCCSGCDIRQAEKVLVFNRLNDTLICRSLPPLLLLIQLITFQWEAAKVTARLLSQFNRQTNSITFSTVFTFLFAG